MNLLIIVQVGQDSIDSIAACYRLDGPGIKSWWGRDFYTPVQTGPWSNSASYTMSMGSFTGVKWWERGVDHPTPSNTMVEGKVELYIHSPSGPS
jgi:hypothetical protein